MPGNSSAWLTQDVIHINCTLQNDSVCPEHRHVAGFYGGLPWRANDEHIGFDLRSSRSGVIPAILLSLFSPFCAWFLLLTINNSRTHSQSSWSVNPHTDTHVHFVYLGVHTNISCVVDTGNGWEGSNEDKDTMSTETPLKVSRAPYGSRNISLFFTPAAHLWGLSCSPP